MSRLHDTVTAAVGYVAAHQQRDGARPWWPGGELDPWDHVECAMALDVGGRAFEAERAYRWLQDVQLDDGSMFAGFRDGVPHDRSRDTNSSTYVAVGAWHHYLSTGDRRFLRDLWPTVVGAIEFALGLQAEHGGIYWSRDEHGKVWRDCLVTGSSSVRAALWCAERIAEVLGESEGARWRPRRLALEASFRDPGRNFDTWEDDKGHFAMDWYYPVLCGILSGEAARRRLERDRGRFLEHGQGCRCRDDQPWVTVAESCELVMAMDACGQREAGRELLEWQLAHQEADGGFRTGTTGGEPWPEGERPSWTAAAAVLAADAIHSLTPAGGLFRSLQGP